MTLSRLLANYIANNDRIRSTRTTHLLDTTIRNFEKYLQRPGTVVDLADDNIRCFAVARRLAGRAQATIDGEVAKLLAIQRWAALEGLLPPGRYQLVKSASPVPRAFVKSQLRNLWLAAYRAEGMIGSVPSCVYWPALLDVAWDTGERIWSIYRLQRHDVDLSGRWVVLRERKGHGCEMPRRIRRATKRSLRRLLSQHDLPEVFRIGSLATVYKHYAKLLHDAGLPTDRRSKFHCLRRSHASYLHVAGGDSRASLGHSSDAVTIKHYLDPRIVAARQPADLLFSPLGWWEWVWGWMR